VEIILVVVVGVTLVATTGLYMYLVDNEKIEPHIPRPVERDQVYRGNFWDAETQKYYKWDELMELKKEREEQNDTT
tara:strand:+ start:325 stop:552 length:228 start_codon:yes stop_codon:yes gene_type:complete